MDQSKNISTRKHYKVQDTKIILLRSMMTLEILKRQIGSSFTLLRRIIDCQNLDLEKFFEFHAWRFISTVAIPSHLTLKTAEDPHIEKMLIKSASIFTDALSRDQDGCSRFHIAAKQGRNAVMRLLLQCRPLIASLRTFGIISDDSGKSLLHLSVEENRQEIAGSLLDANADVNKKDQDGITPIYASAMNGSDEMFSLLTKEGAVIDIQARKENKTILHHSVASGCLPIVKFILQSCNVVKTDFKDLLRTIFLTEIENFGSVYRCLVENRFRLSAVSAEDIHNTGLVIAVINGGYTELFENLLKFVLDPHMRAPIFSHCVCAYTSLLHVAIWFQQKDKLEMLLSRGADSDAVSVLGVYLFSDAVRHIMHVNLREKQGPYFDRCLQIVEMLLILLLLYHFNYLLQVPT